MAKPNNGMRQKKNASISLQVSRHEAVPSIPKFIAVVLVSGDTRR